MPLPALPRSSDRRSRERVLAGGAGMWLLDSALALLAMLVVGLVLRLLRFDDPRWQYNAWTYLLGVPSIFIFASMLARTLVSEQVERSIQIGFLVSVAAHLLMMVVAVNVVLFSGIWPDTARENARRIQSESRGAEFLAAPSDRSRERPDYLEPLATELTPDTPVEIRPASQVDSRLETVREAAQATVSAEPSLDRAQRSASEAQPDIQSEAKPLARPDTRSAKALDSALIAIPDEPTSSTNTPETAPIDAIRDRAAALDAARSDIAPQSSSAPATSGAWLPEWNPNQPLQRSAPDRGVPSAAQAPSRQELAPIERLGSAPASPRSPRRSVPGLGGENRRIDIPQSGDSAGEASTSGARSMLDRTEDGSRVSGRGKDGTAVPSSSRSLEGIPAVEPSVGGLASRLANPNSGAGMSAPMPSVDSGARGLDASKFRRRGEGAGFPKTQVSVPAPAFKQRMRRNEEALNQELQAMGPLGPQTEEAIEKGLEFLAAHQRDDGSWHLEDFGDQPRLRSDTAATALALLSFQGAGYSHQQFKYQQTCRRAIEWLRSQQSSSGDLYRPMDEASDRNAWLYSHAIATLAMCEAYGMTQDEGIRDAAQRSVDFLVDSQDPGGGGWRYAPRVGSDTSVTGWAMMALKSAELAGLKVPAKTYQGITRWLSGAEASARENYLYRYNWQANTPETMHGRVPTPVMTSVGLLMRLYLGWRRTTASMQRGADWILERPPALGTAESPQRDTYYWYYASQVMFHMGGDRWRQWYTSLYPILIRSQETDGPYAGSWNPAGDIPDAWGPYAGRLYVTTMNLLSLEVTYRHLPIYEATAQ